MEEKKIRSKKAPLEPDMFMARLSEQAERYQDMFDFLSNIVKTRTNPVHFSQDERNLLQHAFKSLITPKRQTWRHLTSQTKVDDETSSQFHAIQKYKVSIENRLH